MDRGISFVFNVDESAEHVERSSNDYEFEEDGRHNFLDRGMSYAVTIVFSPNDTDTTLTDDEDFDEDGIVKHLLVNGGMTTDSTTTPASSNILHICI